MAGFATPTRHCAGRSSVTLWASRRTCVTVLRRQKVPANPGPRRRGPSPRCGSGAWILRLARAPHGPAFGRKQPLGVRQLPDGGWNCEWAEGSTRSSFHSTLNSLKGLLAYDAATGGTDATRAARRSGEEYLLRRGLFRRLSTGEPVAPWVDYFTYPFRSFYNVLNAAEYFRRASMLDGGMLEPRMAEAVELVHAARRTDGTWLQARRHPGRVWFEVDAPAGEPSKWLTLFGTRVLAWWDSRTLHAYGTTKNNSGN